MRIVALEEHYTVPRIVAGISPGAIANRGFPGPDFVWAQSIKRNELADLGDARLADMDASGITVQVLSVAGPGADLVPGQAGSTLRAPTTTRWPRPCAAIPIATAASRTCRCSPPKRLRTNSNAQSKTSASTA